MIPPSLIAAVVIAAVAFGTGWTVHGWKTGSERTAETERELQVLASRSRAVDAAAVRHEKFKVRVEVRERIVKQEVDRVVEKPVYRNVCLDPDGLRIIAEDLAARRPAGKPAPDVPGVAAPDGRGRKDRVPVDTRGDPAL